MTMKLKILAISDTHVGEDTSLLSYPIGLQHLWRVLRKSFSPDDPERRFEVEEMILLGDIPDRALASTSQIITHTSALIRTLGSAADIRRGVYIPGNHDHTLWTSYLMRKRFSSKKHQSGYTKPSGEFVIKDGKRCDDERYKPWAEELLSIFFGYPHGSSMRNMPDSFDFIVANPLYATQIKNRSREDRTYIFTHGTHFRREVCLPDKMKRIVDYSGLDSILGHINIESDCDVTKARDLEGLEEAVAPFVDSLWVSSKNNPTSKSDNFWYLLTMLRARLSSVPLEDRKRRRITDESVLLSWDELQLPSNKNRIWKISDQDDSVRRWKDYFLPHMRSYLEQNGMLTGDMTFVYGDTHHGGWGAHPPTEEMPERIRIYNCGGWVMHADEHYHPACHLFAVDDDGEEYMLDVSFRSKDLEIDGESLLKVAAEDAENRQKTVNRILRSILPASRSDDRDTHPKRSDFRRS